MLTELAYRWWSAPGDVILDPFAGGSTRGVIAAMLGRSYIGIELRGEQVTANRQQAADILGEHPTPIWVEGDADDMDRLAPDVQADMILTCPPYHDLEVYSDDPADLSAMPWPDFLAVYRRIIAKAAQQLAPHRFVAIVIGDVRDTRGIYRGLPWITAQAMQDAGLHLYQDAVLINAYGSLQMLAGRTMRATRKLTRLHQYVLVAVKGDPVKAARRLRDIAPLDQTPSA